MKTNVAILLVLLSNVTIGLAQHHSVWLRLTEHRAVTNAEFDSLGTEYLILDRGGTKLILPLDEVLQIRIMSDHSMGNSALLGGGIGLAAGAMIMAIGGSESSPAMTMIAITVIGSMVGGTIGALERPGEMVDLSGLDRTAKRKRMEELLMHMSDSSSD